ncbi:metal-dependent hydrolase [Aneurinibacillus thermoaerophilus]|uniref:Metal-dependent hydrolase n=1 Tax=Aneurinibacillus thermoaerophilus TaxID=143495 RepID=A0ABX8Y8G1_ANETH|nr:metal-dependent hydrolase [Aneurinibacillus thermoaerophilus]QYY41409.1 metal-dependent hydrolase [Aneurinibacillus thermoaerophilus]
MMGRSHLTLGALSGIAVAKVTETGMFDGAVVTLFAAFSALVPDLDADGLLTRKLTDRPLRIIRLFSGYIGVALILLSYFPETRNGQFLTAFIGLLFLGVGFVLRDHASRKWMVTLLGILLMGTAIYLYSGASALVLHRVPYEVLRSDYVWLLGFGLFIALVPHFAHRTYTHTVWALIAWGYIWFYAEASLHISGLFLAAIIGYASHLFADTLTVAGVRYFHPFPPTVKLPLIKTKKDSRREAAVVLACVVLVFFLYFDAFPLH